MRPGEKLYEEVFFGHEAVEPTAHPKVLCSPADPVDDDTADLIETLIRSALTEPDNWDELRVQLRALVPDFHVAPPPPPTDEAERRISGEQRRLRLAYPNGSVIFTTESRRTGISPSAGPFAPHQSSSALSFFTLLPVIVLKFSPVMTGLPVWDSMSSRVLPATAPPA